MRERQPMFDDADLIHRYSRAAAIRDGVLIDVTAVAQEAGIRYPVALTAAAWAECVTVPPGVECQDEAGRLWDVLFLLRCAIKGSKDGAREVKPALAKTQSTLPMASRLEAKAFCTAPSSAMRWKYSATRRR